MWTKFGLGHRITLTPSTICLHSSRASGHKVTIFISFSLCWWQWYNFSANDEWIKTVNFFSSVMKCEMWIDQHDTSVGQRKNPSPRQELNPWPPEHRAGTLSTELRELMESKVILLSLYVIGVLHTDRISSADPVRDSDFFFVPHSCHVD